MNYNNLNQKVVNLEISIPQSFSLFATDMLCGSLAGVGNCFSGYMLDTIKVKMQVHNVSMLSCIHSTFKSEGFSGFYKGIYYPLMTGPLINALNFGVYQFYKNITHQNQLSFKGGLEAGAFSGIVGALVVSPVEVVKCTMQSYPRNFDSSKDCLKWILRYQGIKGLYRGMFSTVVREIPSIAAQFAAYEYLKQYFTIKSPTKQMNIFETALSGGLAGVFCWVVSYPQDIIKTRLQLGGSFKVSRRLPDGGFFDCARQIHKKSGWIGFTKGIEPCLIRAFVANAVAFYIYEQVKRIAKKEL